jgi:3-dehydroquinate dehydratase II
VRVLVLHGPNLNLLGEREPTLYGSRSLGDLNGLLRTEARRLGVRLRTAQSNHEGDLIDRLHEARLRADGVVFNPGAYGHTSYALRDAVAAIGIPVVEVHLTDVRRREAFRRRSTLAAVVAHRCLGHGFDSYVEALRWLASTRAVGASPRRKEPRPGPSRRTKARA